MKINIKLLKKPNKRLLSCIGVYTVFSRAKHNCNSNTMDQLVGFSFINKDWFYVLDNIDISRQICDKLLVNSKLTKIEEKFVTSAMKIYKSYNKVNQEYYDLIEEYKQTIVPKLENLLKSIFTDTEITSKILFLYQPLVIGTKGSAFNNGIAFNVENKNLKKEYFFSLISHELIHCVCSNNKEYQLLHNSKKLNLPKLNKSKHIFNETFTTTVENITAYKLGLEKEIFSNYRFQGRIYNKLACDMEDNIRKLYLKWDKQDKKSKTKVNFVEYLTKHIDDIINI